MNTQNSQEVLIKANDRGLTKIDWLRSYHSFSFGDYYNPAAKGFKTLRVINDDFIKGKSGFGTHPHDNMEILTYILSGEVEHKDTMGNITRIKTGEVQLMSAGSGIAHSEFNPLDQELHLLQIWVRCLDKDKEPSYEQKSLSNMGVESGVKLICSKEGRGNSLTINQNIDIYELHLNDMEGFDFNKLVNNKAFYLHNISARFKLNTLELEAGDGYGTEASPNAEYMMIIEETGSALLFCFVS
jgi:quercetin 2,3-dioxygenase